MAMIAQGEIAHNCRHQPPISASFPYPRQPKLEQKSCHRSETRDNFSDDL